MMSTTAEPGSAAAPRARASAHRVASARARAHAHALAACALALWSAAGCELTVGDEDAGIDLEVQFSTRFDLDRLSIVLSRDGDALDPVLAPADGPRPMTTGLETVGFVVPRKFVDASILVQVEGLSGGAVVADGAETVETERGLVVDVVVVLANANCGNGIVDNVEACDDQNDVDGDGCSRQCEIEPGFVCDLSEPSICQSCGDGLVQGTEECDDANVAAGDGCAAACVVEPGFECAPDTAPSACTPICGDSLVLSVAGEPCDDGALLDGDGCSALCTVEVGYACAGEPSVCTSVCGDGFVREAEVCDDANAAGGDGCDALCAAVEVGFACLEGTEPSVCDGICGDALVRGTEGCDDGALAGGDGCDDLCVVELGFACAAGVEPSVCTSVCGDGLLRAQEVCDDANAAAGDGCSDACVDELGFLCDAAEPTACNAICGDGLVRAAEACDDGALAGGDGCDAVCLVELGFACNANEPSGCAPICGDGLVRGAEACDDANGGNGDGCSAQCVVELGFDCGNGEPSLCNTVCGDAIVAGLEECDDGVAANSDTAPDACRTDCTLPRCGDGVTDPSVGDECDDANVDNEDGCLTGCRLPACGDGFLDGAEVCDDGNTVDLDGCSAACAVEAGFVCGSLPSVCATLATAHTVAPSGGQFTTVTAAVADATVLSGHTLFLAPGTYVGAVTISAKDLTLVGEPGAIMTSANDAANTLTVSNGRTVVVQGVQLRHTGAGRHAVSLQGAGTTVTLRGATLGPSDNNGVDADAGTSVVVDRCLVLDNNEGGLDLDGAYVVTNTVMRLNGDGGSALGGARLAQAGTFAFNTIVGNNSQGSNPSGVRCNVAGIPVTSSIIFDNDNVQTTANCQTGTSVVEGADADPLFDVDGFHLSAGSPILDDAPLGGCPARDFDGDRRPIGAGCAIGADER